MRRIFRDGALQNWRRIFLAAGLTRNRAWTSQRVPDPPGTVETRTQSLTLLSVKSCGLGYVVTRRSALFTKCFKEIYDAVPLRDEKSLNIQKYGQMEVLAVPTRSNRRTTVAQVTLLLTK
ncbi:hypothetical protein RB195_020607 [Necator americanus]|uniref:Uncharacterized protein n=1 Tax=Necator americanus TaxID=51031 RepID=A0ABR1CJM3_NECAM